MESDKCGGPIKTATTMQNEHSEYIKRLRSSLGALGMQVPTNPPLYQLVQCTGSQNTEELIGEIYITRNGASILDYARARQVEVYR